MYFQFDNGGHNRVSLDCVARAIAIALDKSYSSVCRGLNRHAAALGMPCRPSCGVRFKTYEHYLNQRGWIYTPVLMLRKNQIVRERVSVEDGILTRGRFIVKTPGHVLAVIDGAVRDTFDSRERPALGFFYKPTRFRTYVTFPGVRRLSENNSEKNIDIRFKS